MRLLPFFAVLLLTGIVPVYAETATPSAPLPPSVVQGVIQDVAEVTETLGILTVVVLTALGILAVIVIIVLLVAWKGLSPLLGTIKSLNDARGDLQEQLFKRLESGDKERARTAEINERTVNTLSEIETRKEAEAARTDAVTAINQHTDSAVNPIKEAADKTLTTISEIEQQLRTIATTAVTKEEFSAAICKVQESMESLRKVVEATLLVDLTPPALADAPSSDVEKKE